MTQPQESSGDYGYDLAHEESGAARAPDHRERAFGATPAVGGTADRDEDMSYDEAHDF